MKWEFDWEEDKGGNTLFPLPDTRYYLGGYGYWGPLACPWGSIYYLRFLFTSSSTKGRNTDSMAFGLTNIE
jgi:hypothetical protein